MPRGTLICLIFLLASSAHAQTYAENLPPGHEAIQYFRTPPGDLLTRLNLIPCPAPLTCLAKLLEVLGINPDSQALVFSRTSVQATQISPANPRAIYFNDETAVGYVPGSTEIEIARLHPKQGVLFYSLDLHTPGPPVLRRANSCLQCHQGPATLGVPGIFVGSVFPNPVGSPARGGAIITDHRTPFADRWGGWYVNAKHGEQRDRANSVAPDPAEPETLDSAGQQNLSSLVGRFPVSSYLRPISDIVALMVFEHQTQMTNYLTRLGWKARISSTELPEEDIEAAIAYMLFADEAPLREPIEGVSTFAKTFAGRGPQDRKGRSLRDLDLKTRLFRYPLSYMIYSPAFDALPESVRGRVYRRLNEVLSGRDRSGRFGNLSAQDRLAIRDILRETKPDLPPFLGKYT